MVCHIVVMKSLRQENSATVEIRQTATYGIIVVSPGMKSWASPDVILSQQHNAGEQDTHLITIKPTNKTELNIYDGIS